ncbi:MAG: adenylate/guanylate cyclase domain-containing protein [Bacteroidota bacterium]
MRRKWPGYVLKHAIIWFFAFIFWALMREFGQDFTPEEMVGVTFIQRIRMHVALGVLAGLLFGSLEFAYERSFLRNIPFGRAVLISSLSYLATILIFIIFGMHAFTKILGIELNMEIFHEFMFSNEMILLVFYCFLVGLFIDLFKQIDKKFGPGNLWKMVKGEFYRPKEDERIFMFLDLKSSTAMAEWLGHLVYSRLIQECFKDLEVVEVYGAEVYQYVGDEAVLTWPKEKGLENANCLRAYFAFVEQLASRKEFYQKEFGAFPEFKAGLNVGKITIAEVGEIKREIAYHGDAINTAARIQAKCNDFGERVLISENLERHLDRNGDFASSLVGGVLLKGKTETLNIYSVSKVNSLSFKEPPRSMAS